MTAKLVLAATGHRPNKLGGYGADVYDNLIALASDYLKPRRKEIAHVISGMALGWDQAWAEAAWQLGIPFVAAVPCEGQEKPWPEASQVRYRHLLMRAMSAKVITPGPYTMACMQVRNAWMMDNCDRLVALWDGTTGGTANCVNYALRKKPPVKMVNLWSEWKASK